jgi:hypothetical protein
MVTIETKYSFFAHSPIGLEKGLKLYQNDASSKPF